MKRETVALLLETLRLRGGMTPEQIRVAWSTVDITGLRALVAYEGAEAWLYRKLQQLKAVAPDPLMAELRRLVHATSVTNMRIDAQTIAVTSLLSEASIPWALLKGQARRAAVARFPFADARPISDVDILVPEHHADEAWQLLCRTGFKRVYEETVDWKADHHRPVLIDANNVAVELHTTTCMSVAPGEAWRRATEGADDVTWSGLNTRVPNATELVWQALSHSVADGTRGYYLKALLSVAAVLHAAPTLQWEVITQRLANDEVLDNDTGQPVAHERVRKFLSLAAALAGTEIPSSLRPHTRVELVPLLMWRGWVLSTSLGRAVKDRLLEEALRTEAKLPVTPATPKRGVFRALRRRTSSCVARHLYVTWRTTQ